MSTQTEISTIQLGIRTFTVRAFTFDQLPDAMPLFKSAWEKPLAEGGFEPARDLIKLAIGNQVTAEEFSALPAALSQIYSAISTIGFVTGLIVVGERMAQAEMTGTSSTGSTSSPTSAPAADGTGASSGD